jgi:hypothetical protein
LSVVTRPYTIVVEGELGPKYGKAFPGMQLHPHDGITDIAGLVADQAHLRGLLDAVAAYNLTLLRVTPAAPENGGDAAAA